MALSDTHTRTHTHTPAGLIPPPQTQHKRSPLISVSFCQQSASHASPEGPATHAHTTQDEEPVNMQEQLALRTANSDY